MAGVLKRSVVKAPPQKTAAKAATAFFSPVIQPKLTINQPNDPYELEADAVADKVMRMTDHEVTPTKTAPVSIQQKCAHCEEEEKLQMKEEENEEEMIQKKCAGCEDEEEQIQRKCEACEEEEVQRKCEDCEEEEEEVHRKESAVSNTPVVSPAVHQTINSSGSPLDADTRSFMENRFDCDFSEVQIHDDSLAHRSAKDINARAYTHGKHIAFGSGEYQPGTYQGKQLLAHELTHVVQQHNGSKSIQRRGLFILPEDNPLKPLKLKNFLPPTTIIDIRGKTRLKLGSEYNGYLSTLFKGNATKFAINVAFGDMGKGMILAELRTPGFSDTCVVDTMSINPLPPMMEQCGDKFEAGLSSFDVAPQLIPVELPGLDTSGKSGTLALKVEIRDNVIISNEIGAVDKNEAVAWVPGKTKGTLHNFDLGLADFSRQAFLPFIYGKDYDGTNFSGTPFVNHISDGWLIFNSFGILTLPNRQNIHGLIQLGDINRWWSHVFDVDIVGAKDYEFPVNRTDKGELSGEGDGLLLDETWTLKGFNAKGSIRASFINSNLQVEGNASFDTKRAKGELRVIVTDYKAAKQFAWDYLPEEIVNKSKTDPPPNPAERLAFAGAGNIKFTLFDGNKENRKKLPDPKDVVGTAPPEQPNVPLAAEASFVVEPEGYITISGQVQTMKTYTLFPKSDPPYQKTFEKSFTIFKIPGPPGTGTFVNIDFKPSLTFGASIGPATLSDIKAQGLYSSREDTPNELELSAFARMEGEIFAQLKFCIDVKGSFLDLFEISLIEWCPLDIKLAARAVIQAEPTIQIVNPKKDPDRTTPPEYYIRGAFNFDAAAKLVLTLGDSLTVNLSKKDLSDPKKKEKFKDVDKDWRYKRNHKTVENKYGSKDIDIPMDHTLGSEEIPRVSFKNFLKNNLEERIKKLITADRPKDPKSAEKYFEPGTGATTGKDTTTGGDIASGGYEEQGEIRGELEKPGAPPAPVEEPSHVFEESFEMNKVPHRLILTVNKEIKPGGGVEIKPVLMMESELEEVSEKIEEEKQEVKNQTGPVAEFKKKDIAQIESIANRVEADAKTIGVDDLSANRSRFPGLNNLKQSIQQFGGRYGKTDLGTPDLVNKPVCPEPVDAEPGFEITFNQYQGHKDKGRVIGTAAYTLDRKNVKTTQWTIKYKPYGSRAGTVVSAPAYDENCKPLYFITKATNCEGVITDKLIRYSLERTVNGKNIPERKKANWVKAFPLCWGFYQKPVEPVVGIDRVLSGEEEKWHRTHLIHGNMGGPGLFWNLIPMPKHVNNDYLPDQYEKDLKEKVRNGIKTGAQYWFEAKVHYQDEYHPVIGHYNDFVKAIDVEYGELDKDPDDGSWVFLPGVTKSIYFGKMPLKDDLKPNRVRG